MNVGKLLEQLESALKDGTITKKTPVRVGMLSEIYKDGKELVPGVVTTLNVNNVCFNQFPPEDGIPAEVEMVLKTREVKSFYEQNTLIV